MTFREFTAQVESAGFRTVDYGDGHWQIQGGAKSVNYYLDGKHGLPTIYVNGSKRSIRGTHATVEKAIHLARATTGPDKPLPLSKTKKKKIKFQLWNAQARKCCWCRELITIQDATLEHKLPLSEGGSDQIDNLGVACLDCNSRRRDAAKEAPFTVAPSDNPDHGFQEALAELRETADGGGVLVSRCEEVLL